MSTTVEANIPDRIAELAAPHLNTSPDHVTLTKLAGDASTRLYFRAGANGASLIAALYTEPFDEQELASDRLTRQAAKDPARRLSFANDPCAHVEVSRLFLDGGLPVPRILGVSGSDRLLLLEDVGDIKLQDWISGRTPAESLHEYRRAVRMIVDIQEQTTQALATGSICSCLSFDEKKLMWELDLFFQSYFTGYLGLDIDATTNEAVRGEFDSLCSALASQPRVLVHRDFHARNLMMHGDRMVIIDHQDARMGPVSYDLASLVSDPYTALDREMGKDLTEYFIECKSASTLPLDNIERFREELELMTIQRVLKAIGTYASQAMKKNQAYVDYIEPASAIAVASMEKLNRFDNTRSLLEQARSRSPVIS
jgi:aminoglycoside/choline kinase family phosphotransferase